MAWRSHGRIAIGIVALLFLVVFLPPFINVKRYRSRIANSIGQALGRPVTVETVSLRLFPQPAFELGNVSVGEDPDFGAEPMLHAEEVTASLRMSSLWRGRLEVAKLSLKYPSLNLVRAGDGRWNLENLLQHAARIPTAPTTKTRPESRPRFPYIEADGGRINFKNGPEKKVYALSDADFSLWLASETELRTRLTARMVRTDSYLSDTGHVTFNGRFQRAWDLADTPMEVNVRLEKAQLGQLTKFIDGQDHGWRGAVDATLMLAGTPANLTATAQGGIDDFRRYDISTLEDMKLQARCTAKFAATARRLSDIGCQMPMGNGRVTLSGEIDGITHPRTYDLKLEADNVPAQTLVSLVRHCKKDIPDDLTASGAVKAAMIFRKLDPNRDGIWTGGAMTSDVVLRSRELGPDLALTPVQFTFRMPEIQPEQTRVKKALALQTANDNEKKLVLVPLGMPMGGATPVKVTGWITATGYWFSLQGESQVPRLLQVARTYGMRALQANAEGTAKLDLVIAGAWQRFASPKPIGTAQLRAVTARFKGISEPLRIVSATLTIGPDNVTAFNLNAEFTASHLNLGGWVRVPRQCQTVENCPIQFDLRTDQVVTDDLNRLLNPRAANRPWYAILGSKPEPSILGKLQAKGQITAGRMSIKSLVATRITAQAELNSGRLVLSTLHGDIWGGTHSGQLRADFTGDQPSYDGSGTINSVAMGQVAAAMHDNWAMGKANANYHFAASGATGSQVLASAKGEMTFDWQRGVLRHIALSGSTSPLTFRDFSGTLELRGGSFKLAAESKLATDSGIYQVSGTASLGREMDVVLRNGSHAFAVTGTLDRPKVTPTPLTEAQVSLKQ